MAEYSCRHDSPTPLITYCDVETTVVKKWDAFFIIVENQFDFFRVLSVQDDPHPGPIYLHLQKADILKITKYETGGDGCQVSQIRYCLWWSEELRIPPQHFGLKLGIEGQRL